MRFYIKCNQGGYLRYGIFFAVLFPVRKFAAIATASTYLYLKWALKLAQCPCKIPSFLDHIVIAIPAKASAVAYSLKVKKFPYPYSYFMQRIINL